MGIGLLIVGDEILSGRRQDKHLPRVIEILAARGLTLDWAELVGDDRARLTATLRRVFASGDLVFCCGGIGATPDDHTRQAAAAALDRPLALHPEARALIWARIEQMAAEQGQTACEDDPDTQRRLQMGVFPQGADIIPNPYNRIPGFFVGSVYFMPGFPVMAHPMIEWALDTHHGHRHGAADQVRERSVIVQGAMEATLTPLMEQIEQRFTGVKVFSLPSVDHPQWGRHIDLGVKGDAAQLAAAFDALKAGLHQLGARLMAESVR